MLGLEIPLAVILPVAFALYLLTSLVYTAIYKVSFHPLAHIPGPKLAGVTYLYQTYFSLVGGSCYYVKSKRCTRYMVRLFRSVNLTDYEGPLVRITPDELHFSDHANFEIINYTGSKYQKSALYDAFVIGYSPFSSRSPNVHRICRSALNPFFSPKMVLGLENIVQTKAEKLAALATEVFSTGQALNFHYAFRSISVDVTTEYAFGQCYDLMDRPDLGKSFFEIVEGVGPTMWIFQQWAGLQKFALSLPSAVASFLSPLVGGVLQLMAVRSHFHLNLEKLIVLALSQPMRGCEGGPWTRAVQRHDLLFSKHCLPPRRRIKNTLFQQSMISKTRLTVSLGQALTQLEMP
jgi:hypothetical protein